MSFSNVTHYKLEQVKDPNMGHMDKYARRIRDGWPVLMKPPVYFERS